MAVWCFSQMLEKLCHLLGGPSSHEISSRPTLSLLKTLGLRICVLGSKVLAPEAGRRKCSPNSYWKQECVLGRWEDPEPQVCIKSLPSLSDACIYHYICVYISIFLFPLIFGWTKVWLCTLMPLATVVWAEMAVANRSGVLVSTWHYNHGERIMSSSRSNNTG